MAGVISNIDSFCGMKVYTLSLYFGLIKDRTPVNPTWERFAAQLYVVLGEM